MLMSSAMFAAIVLGWVNKPITCARVQLEVQFRGNTAQANLPICEIKIAQEPIILRKGSICDFS